MPTYYPIQQRWRRLRPLFERPFVLELMHSEMECYAEVNAEDFGQKHRPRPFSAELRPADYDGLDWRWEGRRGPQPGYWAWACAGACHWVASHNLIVIMDHEPRRPWQIASSNKHTTVVDMGRQLIFDPGYQAMGIAADECWRDAVEGPGSELLPPGSYRTHHLSSAVAA